MQKVKVLSTLSILSFIVITVANVENYLEVEGQFVQDEFFEITDDKIDLVLKAEDFVNEINEFTEFCDLNFDEYVIDCYYAFEKFVENNEKWIEMIDKLK